MRKLVRLTAHMCVRLLEGTAAMKLARPIVAAVTLFWLLPIRAAPATAPMPKGKDGCPFQYQTMGDYCFPNKYMTAAATYCTTSTDATGTTRTTCRDAAGKTTTCTSRRNATGTIYTQCR
jgi:hypothetical protein